MQVFTILYYTILYYTILYYTILYYTITILYFEIAKALINFHIKHNDFLDSYVLREYSEMKE